MRPLPTTVNSPSDTTDATRAIQRIDTAPRSGRIRRRETVADDALCRALARRRHRMRRGRGALSGSSEARSSRSYVRPVGIGSVRLAWARWRCSNLGQTVCTAAPPSPAWTSAGVSSEQTWLGANVAACSLPADALADAVPVNALTKAANTTAATKRPTPGAMERSPPSLFDLDTIQSCWSLVPSRGRSDPCRG
jgi:hypothetical protein